MSQHDYVIDNQTFPNTRTDLNNALAAIATTNAGATAPSTTYAYQLWYDTTTDFIKMRNADNDAWITLFELDQANDTVSLPATSIQPNPSLIINGGMQVAQRNTIATDQTTGGYFTVDRNKFDLVNLGTHTYSQSTDAPEGFSNSLRVDCTATASLSADSLLYALAQGIEGQNLQLLKKGTSNAESVTVSFYVKSNKTGTYVFEIYDGMNTRHIAKTYTIDSANTWEYKTLTFAGDTSGTLANTEDFGIGLFFWIGAGSNYTTGTLPSSWASVTNANRAAGLNVNMADSTDNDWAITGVKLEVGSTATDFIHRSFGEELNLCQRYYYQAGGDGVNSFAYKGYLAASNFVAATHQHPVAMRAAPTLTKVGTFNVSGIGQPSAVEATKVTYVWQAQKDGSTGTYGFFSNNSGGFTLDAEL